MICVSVRCSPATTDVRRAASSRLPREVQVRRSPGGAVRGGAESRREGASALCSAGWLGRGEGGEWRALGGEPASAGPSSTTRCPSCRANPATFPVARKQRTRRATCVGAERATVLQISMLFLLCSLLSLQSSPTGARQLRSADSASTPVQPRAACAQPRRQQKRILLDVGSNNGAWTAARLRAATRAGGGGGV